MAFAARRASIAALSLTVLAVSAPAPQQTSTTTETRKFQVVAVDGNHLVVREGNETKEYTVPDDCRFTIGDKRLSVHDLQPGMRGTAMFTTRTTVTPITATEVKEVTVMQVAGSSVIVRGESGFHMFSGGVPIAVEN